MRPKNVRRPIEAPPPPGRNLARQVMIAVALLALGASAAVVADRVAAGGTAASPKPSPSAALASATASAAASGSPGPSASPSPSPSPAAPLLLAQMPTAINGTTLTVDSAKDVAALGTGPAARALAAAVKALGKNAADFELAEAYDPAGALKVTILGFRLPGVDPVKLRGPILSAWLAADVPGVTSSEATLAGRTATKVSYGDGGTDQYVLVHGDSLFVIEASDAALAATAAGAIGGGTTTPSAPPSSSPSSSAPVSPTPSASSPSPSPS